MYGAQYDYEFGTRQPLGPQVLGDRILEQSTGVISQFIRTLNVIEDRNDRKRNCNGVVQVPLHEYEGPAQLNIEKDDMIFVARGDVPEPLCGLQDRNAFASFNGLPKFTRAEEYRLRYRFLGLALTPFAFNNECQGKGITVMVRGVGNFINRSGETLMPGDNLTWEPDFAELANVAEQRRTKRQHVAGMGAIKGRFVKYRKPGIVSVFSEDGMHVILPSLGSGKLSAVALVELAMDQTIGTDDIVGINMECTQPNQWGRVVIR